MERERDARDEARLIREREEQVQREREEEARDNAKI